MLTQLFSQRGEKNIIFVSNNCLAAPSFLLTETDSEQCNYMRLLDKVGSVPISNIINIFMIILSCNWGGLILNTWGLFDVMLVVFSSDWSFSLDTYHNYLWRGGEYNYNNYITLLWCLLCTFLHFTCLCKVTDHHHQQQHHQDRCGSITYLTVTQGWASVLNNSSLLAWLISPRLVLAGWNQQNIEQIKPSQHPASQRQKHHSTQYSIIACYILT